MRVPTPASIPRSTPGLPRSALHSRRSATGWSFQFTDTLQIQAPDLATGTCPRRNGGHEPSVREPRDPMHGYTTDTPGPAMMMPAAYVQSSATVLCVADAGYVESDSSDLSNASARCEHHRDSHSARYLQLQQHRKHDARCCRGLLRVEFGRRNDRESVQRLRIVTRRPEPTLSFSRSPTARVQKRAPSSRWWRRSSPRRGLRRIAGYRQALRVRGPSTRPATRPAPRPSTSPGTTWRTTPSETSCTV